MRRKLMFPWVVAVVVTTAAFGQQEGIANWIGNLKGKDATLRAPYRGSDVQFAADGTCRSHCDLGGWAGAGTIELTDIKNAAGTLTITGKRLLVFYDLNQKLASIDAGQKVRLRISVADPLNEAGFAEVMRKIFRTRSEPMPNGRPPDLDDGNSPFELRRDQRRDQKLGIQARKKSSAEWKDTIEVDEPIPVGQRYSGEPVYIVSKAVSPPQVTKAPDPEYPEYERQQKREGTTVLRIVVGELGYVDNIAAEREGFPGFVPSAVRAVTKWAFRPAKLKTNGTPVACLINVEVNFRLY